MTNQEKEELKQKTLKLIKELVESHRKPGVKIEEVWDTEVETMWRGIIADGIEFAETEHDLTGTEVKQTFAWFMTKMMRRFADHIKDVKEWQ